MKKCFRYLNINLLILFHVCTYISCSVNKYPMNNAIQNHVIRLKPGMDLKKSIENYISDHKIQAAWIVTCVGSLTKYELRLANQPQTSSDLGHFEIVSLTGTLSTNGSHLHISISDSTGKTIGGHLADGNIIYTTAEIVIQSDSSFTFKREQDGTTPWQELQIYQKHN